MDNTMLDHLIWDEYDRQMKVMDEQESEPGIERYPEIRFKREYLVFKPAHFTAGRIFTLGEKTQLPNNSILHVLDNQAHLNEAPVDVPRLEEHPLIDRESFRKFVYHIRNFNLEGPLHYEDKYIYRQSGLPANLLKFRAQHGSRFRYVNLIGELPPRREALCIINHNPLFRARFFGRLQTYRKLTLIWTSILNTVCSLDHMHKNQFIEIPWGPNVYMKNLFVMNRDKLTIATIKRPEDPQYFLMMHLVNFMWDTATTSIFKQLPEEILPQINLILNFGDRYLFYNLAELKQLNQPKNKVYFKFINQLNMLSLTGQMDLETTSSNVVKQVKQIVKETRVPSTDDENGETVTVVEPINTASEQEETVTTTEVPHEDTVVEKLIAKTVEVIRQTPQVDMTKPAPHVIQGITKSPAPSISKKDLKTLTETKKLKETVAKDKARPAASTTPMKEIVKTYMDEGDKEALEFINQNETLTLPQRKRYERLATKYKDLTLGDKTLEQVLEEDNDITLEPEVIDEKKVGELPDKSALTSSVVTFDHSYMKKSFNKHLVETLTSFRKQGVYLTDLKVVHENDRMNNFVHYTCKYEDINGKSSTIKFRLPQLMNDGRIRIDGNYQVLKKQRINLPIVKISDTEVSLASNYNKTRVERNTNKSHNYFSFIDSFLNSEKSTAQIEFGNCSINLPLAYDYTSLAPRYRRVTFRKNSDTFDLWFDYKDRESHFDGKSEQMFALESQYGTYFGHNSESWLFIDNSNTVSAVNKHGGEQIDWRYTSLLSVLAESLKEGETYKKNFTEYTTIKILDKMLPIIFLLGYQYGLRRTLDYLGIKYTITEAKNRTIVGDSSTEDYEAGMTSSNPDYGKVTRLHEIYDSMKDFDYGMWDRSTNKPMERKWFDNEAEDMSNNTAGYMWKNHRILTPEETAKYKLGTCWEQSIYTAYMCDKYKIRWKMLWYDYCNYYTDIKEYYPGCHTTIITEINGKYYWIEHAWWTHRGVRKYETFDECINDIIKNHVIKMNSITKPADCPNGQPTGVMSIGFVDNGRIRNFYNDRNITQQKFFNAMPPCAIYDHTAQRDRYFQHIEVKSPLSVKATFTDGKTQVFNAKIPTGKPSMASMTELYGTESFDIDISKIDGAAIVGNEGLLMKWLEFNMWIYRKLYSTWAKLNKYDDVVFVWCNGKVNPKKNTFVFNSASIAYWDPKITTPMRILQKLYEVEDKEYRIVVPKRLPIIKTWKGNFLYINDILKILPDFARDVKKYAKIDKEYKTLFDKNMYAFFWTVHKSLIDYLKSRGCELYVDKTIKEKEDVHGNKYREGNEAFDIKNIDKIKYLDEIDDLGLKQDEYLIGASVSCILYGMNIENKDIDICVTEEALKRIMPKLHSIPGNAADQKKFSNATEHLDIASYEPNRWFDFPKYMELSEIHNGYRFSNWQGLKLFYFELYLMYGRDKHRGRLDWIMKKEGSSADAIIEAITPTDEMIKPIWDKIVYRYKKYTNFDLSHMEWVIDTKSHFNNGKVHEEMLPFQWGASWTKQNIIYINQRGALAYSVRERLTHVVTREEYIQHLSQLLAHELAHEIYGKIATEEYKTKILTYAEEIEFDTDYLHNLHPTTNNYNAELFCEYLSREINKDSPDEIIQSVPVPVNALATGDITGEKKYRPQTGDIAIRFADRTLWFNRYPLTQSLIVAGLDYFDCSQYSLADLESKDIYYQMLTDKGLSTNYLKGISSFFDLFVDGMTYEVLKSMNEPTNVRDLLIRSTEMLTTTDYLPPASRENHRLRGAEQINALIYNEMSRNFAAYQARRGKANTFSVNPDAIFLRFISNASLVTSEASNPIQCMTEATYMTYAGSGGRSADSFVVRDRRFTEDDIGIISESTVDNQKVGINAQLSQNSGIADLTGKLQPKSVNDLQPADVLSSAALIMPFSTNDDKIFVRMSSNRCMRTSLIAETSYWDNSQRNLIYEGRSTAMGVRRP